MMRPLSSIQHTPLCRGFTLAELLAVIVIMSLLMVAVVPSLRGLTAGASLSAATMQVRTSMIAARQNAVTRRIDTSVLFPKATDDAAKGYHALAIFSTNYVNDWQFFPPGIYFQVIAGPDTVTSPLLNLGSASINGCTYNRLGERNSATPFTVKIFHGLLNGTAVQGLKGGTNQVDALGITGIVQVKRL